MKRLKLYSICALMACSQIVFAGKGPVEVNLGSVTVAAGGKAMAQISFAPIQDYAASRWNIHCSIPNPTDTNVIMKFGITMVRYAAWPTTKLNGSNLSIMGDPQGSLVPGENSYVLEGVTNYAFTTLNFINFDNVQNITVQCNAVLSTN